MAAKNERAPIEPLAPATPEAPGLTVRARFEEATLRLAFAVVPAHCAARTVMPVLPVLPMVPARTLARSHGVTLSSVCLPGSRIG